MQRQQRHEGTFALENQLKAEVEVFMTTSQDNGSLGCCVSTMLKIWYSHPLQKAEGKLRAPVDAFLPLFCTSPRLSYFGDYATAEVDGFICFWFIAPS